MGRDLPPWPRPEVAAAHPPPRDGGGGLEKADSALRDPVLSPPGQPSPSISGSLNRAGAGPLGASVYLSVKWGAVDLTLVIVVTVKETRFKRESDLVLLLSNPVPSMASIPLRRKLTSILWDSHRPYTPLVPLNS